MNATLDKHADAGYMPQQKDGRTDHIREYKKNESKNRYARLITELVMGDEKARKVLEYLHGERCGMESISYENRNCFTIVPDDVAVETGLSKNSVKKVLSALSTYDFPVLSREGRDTYHLTEMGDACLSDLSYRRNLEKLRGMPNMKIDVETDL
ncbi:MAG: hypothetical protein HY833_03335 [Candidatus Aenigmarchaeota archaeon]|nr:hypothetical protein [Candidatus Aenigmarchaeota archaeon]